MNEYKVTIIIEGAEDTATIEYIAEAKNLDEAERKILNDLDI